MKGRTWAVDVEGNGMSPPEIVEVAIVELDGLALTGLAKQWRVRPAGGISPMATRIHGIKERDVADLPGIDEIADDIAMWLDDRPIVGHNVRVDLDIIGRFVEGWEPGAAYDTLRLARRFLPDEPKHGLEHLSDSLGLAGEARERSGGSAHGASYDATAAALLMIRLLSPLAERQRADALRDADLLHVDQGRLL